MCWGCDCLCRGALFWAAGVQQRGRQMGSTSCQPGLAVLQLSRVNC